MPQISVIEFEEKVLEIEEVTLIIRAHPHGFVEDYGYERKAAGGSSITDWLDKRIKPCVGDNSVVIIDGYYRSPHGRTKLSTLRKSYEQ